MKNSVLTFLTFITSISFLCACNDNGENKMNHNMDSSVVHVAPNDTTVIANMPKENDMMKSMMATMGEMDTIKMYNNFDIDFANIMIIHHQAAVDMSELEVAKGGDVQIINIAKNIITAQKAEIVQMKNFIASYNHSANKIDDAKISNTNSQNILVSEMKNMMNEMHNMKMTGNTDDDYVMLMIPHHVSAVKMAKSEINYGKEIALKKIAQKIIVDQNKEIATFVAWSTKLR